MTYVLYLPPKMTYAHTRSLTSPPFIGVASSHHLIRGATIPRRPGKMKKKKRDHRHSSAPCIQTLRRRTSWHSASGEIKPSRPGGDAPTSQFVGPLRRMFPFVEEILQSLPTCFMTSKYNPTDLEPREKKRTSLWRMRIIKSFKIPEKKPKGHYCAPVSIH